MSHRFVVPLPLIGPLLAVALLGAHCNSSTDAGGPLGAKAAVAAPAPGTAAPNDGLTEEEAKKLLPGIDTSGLTPRQRSDLNELTSDTFCPCAGTTVAGCLRTQPTCTAATRLTELAKRMLLSGQSQASTLLRVESYYGSFSKERRKDVAAIGPTKGPADAKITLVEFSDFECPACGAAQPELAKLVAKYPNDVRLVFRHFPLPRHEFARAAAVAAIFAAEKGRFWELADLLFARQEGLSFANIQAMVKEVGLDPAGLAQPDAETKLAAMVEADIKAGEAAVVNSTPTIYVNGRQLVLPANLEYLSWTIDDELEWMSKGGSWTVRK